jgi:alpha-L-rhamnosidase
MSASSTHSGFSPAAAADGMTDSSQWGTGPGGGGWNDGTAHAFPDTLTATWAQPVAVKHVRIYTLDSAKHPASRYGIRDASVQVKAGGEWKTVADIRNNNVGVIESSFPQTTTEALRLVISDSNDHDFSRIVELEAYGTAP